MGPIASVGVSKSVRPIWLLAGVLIAACSGSSAPPVELAQRALSGPAPVLTATAPSATTVALIWSDVGGETGYAVDRSTDGGVSFTPVQSLDANVTTWTDAGRAALTTYCYRVRAYDGAGSSTSNVGCVLTPRHYEAESLARSTSYATASVVSNPEASGGSLVSATVSTVGGWVELTTTTPATGVYGTKLRYLATSDAGRFVVKVGGVQYGGEVDGYAPSPTFREVYLGEADLTAASASRKLRFELTGRNPLSSGDKIQIDIITLYVAQYRYEGESSGATTSSGDSQSNSNVQGASNGKVNVASLNAVGDYVRYTIAVGAPGTYQVSLRIRKGANRGRFRAWLDETTAVGGEVDGYAASNTLASVALGEATIGVAGSHTVKLKVTGKNSSASSYGVTTDYIDLRLAAGNGCSLFGDAIPDGTTCDDASLCTQNDVCQAGSCTGGTSVVCTASDQCHDVGTCDPGTGLCPNLAKPDGASCSDDNPCTQIDTCQAGTCTGGSPVTCASSDQCHDDGTCDPATGQCSIPAKPDGTSCNDGDACTQTDTCQAGACTGTNPVTCSASDQCHEVGTCDPGTGQCSNPAKPNGASCSDGNACTQTDTCQAGACTGGNPVTCAPLDQCHDAGTCDPGTGLCPNPAKPDGTSCSDGNACTQSDTCQAGACMGTNPVTCAASDQCHDAGTCDPGTGLCPNPAKPDGTSCSDGNACTQTDTCQAGACTGTNPVACAASDQCHDAGTCDPGSGLCSNPAKPDGASCSDGNACTQSDTCRAGACMGASPVTCAPSDQCHDAGTCDPGTGQCSNPAMPDGASCSDGNACTQTDTCQTGACTGGNPVTCAPADQCHDAGTCDPGTGQCSNPAVPDGTSCSDGNACTQTDTCQAGICVAGPPVTCTSDECHEVVDGCDQYTGQCNRWRKVGACLRNSPRVSAGSTHTCAIRADGSVACWGRNIWGEASPPAGTFTQLAAGDGWTCGLEGNGPVRCWGNYPSQSAPTWGSWVQVAVGPNAGCGLSPQGWVSCWGGLAASGSGYAQIAVGDDHGCGVTVADSVQCWGNNEEGQTSAPGGTFVQVVAGSHRSCGLRAEGAAECWGKDVATYPPPALTFERLAAAGADTCGLTSAGEIVCWGGGRVTQTPPPQGPFVNLTVGAAHACGIRSDDSIACWGSLWDTPDAGGVNAVPVGQFQEVSTGSGSRGCRRDASGQVTCWGDGTQPPAEARFRQIAVGVTRGCGILADGSGLCWCDVSDTQCVPPPGPVSQVAIGSYDYGIDRVCWLGADGSILCPQDTPPSGVHKQIAVGYSVACAVREDGTAVCWGYDNGWGLLTPPAGTFKQLSIGSAHACGVRTDGTVACWGYDEYGQATPPAGQFSAVAAGRDLSCGIRSDGSLACWGGNPYRPVVVPPAGPFQQLSAGHDTFCAISTSGQEWCWGSGWGGFVRQPLACAVEPDGACISTDPVVCPPPVACHTQGAFDPATRRCTDPVLADGTACNDGSACTQTDTCQAGACTGVNPVVCTSANTCESSTCDPSSGQCVIALLPDGTRCDDHDACSQIDVCSRGWCLSGEMVVCPPSTDPCQIMGCNSSTGQCQLSPTVDGASCEDGNGCTLDDTCHGGVCSAGHPVECAAAGDCYQAGTCQPSTGQCSYPAKSEGASCDDRNPCTATDVCQAGACIGGAVGGTCEAASSAWLAAGDRHTCALRPDGTIACWGNNYAGASTPPLGTWKQVSAGTAFTCALRSDGTPQCWGTNLNGQTYAPPGPYTQLASGGTTTCALTASGLVECWGAHAYAWASGTFAQIAMGEEHGCGLRTDGSISCWGAEGSGQSMPPAGTGYRKITAGTYHSCALTAQGNAVCWGDLPGTPAPTGELVDVAAGLGHTCGLRSNGTVVCWGQTRGSPPPGGFVAIAAGTEHDCAMRGDGAVVGWGVDDAGQATVPTGTYSEIAAAGLEVCGLASDGKVACWGNYNPAATPADSFVHVAKGIYGGCGIRPDGSLACWSYGARGPAPMPIPTGTFTQLSVGDDAACAVKADGTLACWGFPIDSLYTDIPSANNFVEVTVGAQHACARATTGQVTCWGTDYSGVFLVPAATFTRIASGAYHVCGLKSDASIVCWGRDWSGQASPPAGTDFVQIVSGRMRSCALTAQGAALCWGEGQQGDPYGGSTRIGPLVKITLNVTTACALNASGQMLCWGDSARQPL
jgi:alpha-tubulin suppressor-like RCC1 family protein